MADVKYRRAAAALLRQALSAGYARFREDLATHPLADQLPEATRLECSADGSTLRVEVRPDAAAEAIATLLATMLGGLARGLRVAELDQVEVRGETYSTTFDTPPIEAEKAN